jgi:hypothetical protein
MIVSGDQWQIKTFDSGPSPSETTCDGVSIYHFSKDAVFSLPKRFGQPSGYHVHVESAPFPSEGYAQEILFLAYAAKAKDRTNLATLPAPWLDPRAEPNAHIYEAEFLFNTAPPYLPASGSYVATRERMESAADSPWLNVEGFGAGTMRKTYRSLRWDVSNGFVGGVYKVKATTNLSGMTLPTDFSLTTYYPTEVSRVADIYFGTNITIKITSQARVQPSAIDKVIYVTDFRLHDTARDINYLQYLSKDWIRSPESQVLRNFFSRKSRNPKLTADDFVTFKTGPGLTMKYLVLTVLLIPPLLMFFFRKKSEV